MLHGLARVVLRVDKSDDRVKAHGAQRAWTPGSKRACVQGEREMVEGRSRRRGPNNNEREKTEKIEGELSREKGLRRRDRQRCRPSRGGGTGSARPGAWDQIRQGEKGHAGRETDHPGVAGLDQ